VVLLAFVEHDVAAGSLIKDGGLAMMFGERSTDVWNKFLYDAEGRVACHGQPETNGPVPSGSLAVSKAYWKVNVLPNWVDPTNFLFDDKKSAQSVAKALNQEIERCRGAASSR
jgi:hypothetical protein